MPKKLRIADEFICALAGIYSESLLDRIHYLLTLLPSNPELGSANVRQSLVKRYGTGLRKIPVSTFVIIYRIDEECIDVLALVYGPSVI